ncbi:MAG: ABC transporter substrate-binding protein [Anaerolineales bacterium]|nr:ABC transporter substrate-binding protein [Anaerolineales bacterium]
MKKKVLYVFLLAALILSACGSSGGQPTVARIGWAGSPDTVNPGSAVLTEAYTIFALVYDAMYKLNLDGTFSLGLADSVEHSQDGLVYTYKIHQGVKFHDGQPLTSKDIKFSYELYKTHDDFPYMNSYTAYIESVEAPDDSTVVLTLSEAIPNIESQLVFMYILPEHIWKDHAEGAAAVEFENFEMIGTGPFKLVEYKQNEFVHLAANKEHFQTPPKVDEIIFQTFESQDVLVQAIKSGQVDMITEMPATAVGTLKEEATVTVINGAPFAPGVSDIILNQATPENCPTDAGGLCTGHPALQDRNVRLAMAHATDKQKLIDVVLLGYGTPGLTLIPDGLGFWYNDTIKDYEFDVAKANQILDDAGYADKDGDGIREMPDGSQPLNFRINWPSDSIDAPRQAELLSEMWSAIGVKTELAATDPDALTSQCCPVFDYDIILWGWGSDPDPNLLLNVQTTGEIPTGYNETGYSNPEFDALYAQQAVELDLDKRKELVWKMQEVAFNDVVYIIPYYEQNVQAFRTDRFTGWLTDFPKIELSDVTSLVVIEPVK